MNELDWLAARRPDTESPDEATTARARTALLEHMRGAPRRPVPARRPRRRTRPRLEFMALAAALAAALVVAAGALPSGDGAKPALTTEPQAQAAIVTLSKHLHNAPAPPGDATLVHRSHHLRTGHDFAGVDLYLDDGRYFYGATDAELRADAASGDDMSEGNLKREIAAALAADREGGQAARTRMIDATFAGGRPPTPAEVARAQRLAQEKARATGIELKPVSRESMDNNRLWIGAMDALIAGAGRADVRAGVMNLLSTVAAVHSERHGNTIAITNTDFTGHYEETLIVGARSGVIEKMTGGVAGRPPDVTVDYAVRRVTAAGIVDGRG
jgi:hypothetical protein